MCSYACGDNVPDVVPAQPCTSTAGLLQRMDGLTATCCPDGSCDASLPTACDFSCELAVLAFVADCQTFFGIEQLEPIMQPVIEPPAMLARVPRELMFNSISLSHSRVVRYR